MAIKRNQLSEVKSAMTRADRDLQDVTKINHLPLEVINKITALQNELKNFDLSEYKSEPVMLTGKVMEEQEVLTILKEQSGYTKWNVIDPFKEYGDYEFEPQDYKSPYGVDFDEKEVKEYMFRRDVNGRDDIRSITVVAFPEHFSVNYSTSRVSGGADSIMNLEEFKAYLENF